MITIVEYIEVDLDHGNEVPVTRAICGVCGATETAPGHGPGAATRARVALREVCRHPEAR
jgi:hypothetical protein